ncbi:MAG: flavodoxin [Candidatus Avispirillum sp.]
MKRKLIAFAAATLLIAPSLFACAAQEAADNAVSRDSSQSTQTSQITENKSSASENSADSEKKAENTEHKILVVYYSATGTTKQVAEYIAAETGGELFELVPKQPYSSDDLNWRDENSRVSREHEDVSERNTELSACTVDNWSEYDTVFIGYPIWWGIAAWPVNGFIEANDFSGKTVIPFCTSVSSGMGDSGHLLEEAAKAGTWLEGERFSSGDRRDDLGKWLVSIGY